MKSPLNTFGNGSSSSSSGLGRGLRRTVSTFLLLLVFTTVVVKADNYEVAPGHESAVFAMGCFWCGEEAFERYAPGVVEAVSGYAGGSNDNPTYRNHPGHYEVVLVEYDPNQTSFGVLVGYAWRNIDPFNGRGQFCDFGTSYLPAIFYATENEKAQANAVLEDILRSNHTAASELWNPPPERPVMEGIGGGSEQQSNQTTTTTAPVPNLRVPLLPRPKFWIAEEYHQDYYIKNPGRYLYYKERCGRTERLKEVWGEEQYECYHDLNSTCFETVESSDGTRVNLTINAKEIPEEGEPVVLPYHYWIVIGICAGVAVVLFAILGWVWHSRRRKQKRNDNNNGKDLEAIKEGDV